MAKLNADQLARHLAKLAPVYLVSGDEPLLVQEACDSIRSAARKQGFSERELFHAEGQFDWQQVVQSGNSLNLFAERKIIEVRLTGKFTEAAGKALVEFCRNPSPDNLLLLVSPKLDKNAQNSGWYKAVDQTGGILALWPVSEKQLPRWIDTRLRAAGLDATPEALDLLCAKVEGNLLAAVQEIEKLKLIANDNTISAELMASLVADNARYDVFGLVDKAVSGDASGALRTLQGLRAEGEEVTLVIWALAREVRTLAAMQQAQSLGQGMEQAARNQGIFDPHFSLMRQAMPRFKPAQLRLLLRECALADRALKGAAKLSPWDVLQEVVLTLAGARVLSNGVLQRLLR